ncbi:DUF1801 domain-containing protein [Erythrobacter colymbi]|uniref:DUF1801 domain-containing protein n=1 Tax=Erythrobacter colymbi TaxID=1161202 RepID=UPI000A3D3DEB|nr:DUF1801 domain-containing protein [Erythrobacter colymbi]
MAEAKTTITDVAAQTFIDSVEPPARAEEARALDALFRKVTGEAPKMWGPSIVGYGEYSTVYDSGRKVNSLKIGFSPRKAKHVLYLSSGYTDEAAAAAREAALARLGKHETGKGCLYVKKLSDVDPAVLEELIAIGWTTMQRAFPDT